MEQPPKPELKKHSPLFIALAAALVIAIFYLLSGQGSLDQNTRSLQKTAEIKQIQTKDNTLVINCKNGESYEIVYQPGQTNYEGLVYDKCGADGAITGTQQKQ